MANALNWETKLPLDQVDAKGNKYLVCTQGEGVWALRVAIATSATSIATLRLEKHLLCSKQELSKFLINVD